MTPCPLCQTGCSDPFLVDRQSKAYYRCATCDLRFLDPARRLTQDDEKARYLEHNNDVLDPRYQGFVDPLRQEIRSRVAPGSDVRGLDFGAGTGPVLSKLLSEDGYSMALYDPFFWPNADVLNARYEFAVACEVVEHLFDPAAEFARLRGLLRPGGWLGLMTHLMTSETDFERWYYRQDPTHVVFYSRSCFEWIARTFGFSQVDFSGERVVLLRKDEIT